MLLYFIMGLLAILYKTRINLFTQSSLRIRPSHAIPPIPIQYAVHAISYM
jgi:hypothetical protein